MDEKAGMNEAAAAPSAVNKGATGNKFLMIGILAGVIVVNTMISFILVKVTRPPDEETKAAQAANDSLKHATELTTSMGATTAESPIEAIVNIADTDGERFIKAAIIFEYDDVKYPEFGEELARRAPKFKDLLINHLSRLTLADVTEPDAKDKIRNDLLRLVNVTLPPDGGEVREVLFTTYIIQ
jgi:flagellar basal body-associated protein FliL